MSDLPLLSVLIFLPLLGAIFVMGIQGDERVILRNARHVALWTSVLTFVLSLIIWTLFDAQNPHFQLTENRPWIPSHNIQYHLGIDGISLLFVLLTTFLVPLCIWSTWEAITHRVKEFMAAFLVLESFTLGTFCALDFVLFYLFFEAVLIPMFLIIGIWGGERRIYASFKFFLYTFLGSVCMLVAILTIFFEIGTTDIPLIMSYNFDFEKQWWLWLAFFAAFAVKIPMWPLHTWLPDAHVEAPTSGSMILAGILLKMGGYGFVRFCIPIFPEASAYFQPLVFVLSLVAIIYASLVAWVQEDMKKLVAYSSIAHMGFVTLGAFTLTLEGLQGAVFQMISHGLISAGLFLCVGVVYDRMHTRELSRYGGLLKVMPKYGVMFLILTMASAGLPSTSGFIGEFLVLLGAYSVNLLLALGAATAMVFGAVYALMLYRRVMLGKIPQEKMLALPDLSGREVGIFVPLIASVVAFGIHPAPILNLSEGAARYVLSLVEGQRLQQEPTKPGAEQKGTGTYADVDSMDGDRPEDALPPSEDENPVETVAEAFA